MTSADSSPPANTPPSETPAGWYPDHTGEPRMRWWDGSAWSDHVTEPSIAAPAASAAPLRNTVPATTPTGNVFIWILVLLPVISILLGFTIDYRAYGLDSLREARLGTRGGGDLASMAALGVSLVGLVLAGVHVLLAYFDFRRLRATGVERPFHWAWAFFGFISGLGVLVYVIGRSVIVFRRSGRGLAPLWVGIAVVVVELVLGGVHTAQMLGPIFDQLGNGSFDSGTLDS